MPRHPRGPGLHQAAGPQGRRGHRRRPRRAPARPRRLGRDRRAGIHRQPPLDPPFRPGAERSVRRAHRARQHASRPRQRGRGRPLGPRRSRTLVPEHRDRGRRTPLPAGEFLDALLQRQPRILGRLLRRGGAPFRAGTRRRQRGRRDVPGNQRRPLVGRLLAAEAPDLDPRRIQPAPRRPRPRRPRQARPPRRPRPRHGRDPDASPAARPERVPPRLGPPDRRRARRPASAEQAGSLRRAGDLDGRQPPRRDRPPGPARRRPRHRVPPHRDLRAHRPEAQGLEPPRAHLHHVARQRGRRIHPAARTACPRRLQHLARPHRRPRDQRRAEDGGGARRPAGDRRRQAAPRPPQRPRPLSRRRHGRPAHRLLAAQRPRRLRADQRGAGRRGALRGRGRVVSPRRAARGRTPQRRAGDSVAILWRARQPGLPSRGRPARGWKPGLGRPSEIRIRCGSG